MECVICKNGTTKPGFANVPIVRGDKIIFVKNTPAQICSNCDKYYIDSAVAKELYNNAYQKMNGGVEMEVTTYVGK